MKIVYCDVCTLPVEYCEFTKSRDKCREWLREHDTSEYGKIYGEVTELEEKLENVKIEKGKAKTNSDKNTPKSLVTISLVERTKRKRNVTVQGLEKFGIDLKKFAKQCANKFACGASVSQNAAGMEEVLVQGDCVNELKEMLVSENIKEENIEIHIKTKKKE